MSETLFCITNILSIVGALAVAWGIFLQGRQEWDGITTENSPCGC